MACFAKLKPSNNVVLRVLTVSNNSAPTEQEGIDFLKNLYGNDSVWKQTWEDGSQRKNYAAEGYTYDSGRDAFIPPQPYPTWVLNEGTCDWDPPVAAPTDVPVDSDGNQANYKWDEDSQSWIVASYPADPS